MTIPADMAAHNQRVIEEFRANGGAPGRALLLLTTTGARTGRRRTTPMMYVPDGERLLVLASNAGASKTPDWYYNLVANPDVTVEITGATFQATAAVTRGVERERVWAAIVAQYPFFIEHEARAGRTIPVVALSRA